MSVKFALPEWNEGCNHTKCFRCVLFQVMYTIFHSNSFENLIGCNCGAGRNEKGLQKIFQCSEILFGDLILCSNRFFSNLFSDCLLLTIYSDKNISIENFVMSLLGHVYLRRVQIYNLLIILQFSLKKSWNKNFLTIILHI